MMSNYSLINLPYIVNLGDYYQQLSNLPGFVLLESADTIRGRYDILSAYPYQTLTSECSTADAFLHALQRHLLVTESQLDLPFQGGAIGYFSYDFGGELVNLPCSNQQQLNTIPSAHIGLYDWAIIVDHHLKKITLFAAHTQPSTTTIMREIIQRWQGTHIKPLGYLIQNTFTPLISKPQYQDAFFSIHSDLKQGRCYQVNYTQPFKTTYQGDPWAIYRNIRIHNPVPYSAFIKLKEASILSFSPERFIQLANGKLLTSPIKGTKPRSQSIEMDNHLKHQLLNCPKNRAENVMIVDLMRNDLSKIAKRGTVTVPDLFAVESYKGVHHLVSHITADCLDTISAVNAFAGCFPGGSITGTPKREAMCVIGEQEPYNRGVYCGSIGYFSNHGRFDTNIAIRTMVATDEALFLAAGGAIVVDSVWEEEFQEYFTKIAAILHRL